MAEAMQDHELQEALRIVREAGIVTLSATLYDHMESQCAELADLLAPTEGQETGKRRLILHPRAEHRPPGGGAGSPPLGERAGRRAAVSTVFRFMVSGPGPFAIEVPKGSTPIFFGWQEDRQTFSVWYQVPDTTKPGVRDVLQFIGTGHDLMLTNPEHIGSCVMPDGFHVFHLFRERP